MTKPAPYTSVAAPRLRARAEAIETAALSLPPAERAAAEARAIAMREEARRLEAVVREANEAEGLA